VRRLRFIDEAGSHLSLTRRFGRVPKGERVAERVPRNYGHQTSIISAVSLAGASVTMTVEGAVDTAIFNVYVEQVLRPTMAAGDILVLDNLSAHRASGIEEVAAECGASVLWLPPYSPDFSPIELMWSKIKAALRAAKARTREELEQALGTQAIYGPRPRHAAAHHREPVAGHRTAQEPDRPFAGAVARDKRRQPPAPAAQHGTRSPHHEGLAQLIAPALN
jgi:transposase